ncbi:MAG: hypothetical protein LBH80_08005 [Prevotellaceae bacterium]|jgi:hypothetical protein|nr:hypothetical protein [Prevotellaceae bacterium]
MIIDNNYSIKLLRCLFAVVLLCFASAPTLKAQLPGGASGNLELWLRSDYVLTETGKEFSNVIAWPDRSVKRMRFIKNGLDSVPRIRYDGFNFQPAVSFATRSANPDDGDKSRKLVSDKRFGLSHDKAYHTFWVSEVDLDNIGGYASVFSFKQASLENNGWRKSGGIWVEINGKDNTDLHITNKPYGFVTSIRYNDGKTKLRVFQNGIEAENVPNFIRKTTIDVDKDKAIIGNARLDKAEYFSGNVYEVIVISTKAGTALPQSELDKVHTYLALKYGFHQPANYVNSQGRVIWNHYQNMGYNNNIFGLINDPDGHLKINQAKSSDKNFMTAFFGNLEMLEMQNNSDVLNEGEYVLFGNSSFAGSLSDYRYEVGEAHFANGVINDSPINYLNGIKMKARTNVYGGVTLNIKPTLASTYVVVSKNPTFSPAVTRAYKVDEGIAENVFLEDGDFIGFVFMGTAPGGVQHGLRMWMKADAPNAVEMTAGGKVLEWDDYSGSGIVYRQQAEMQRPVYDPCNRFMNYHPAIKFSSANETFMYTNDAVMTTAAPDHYTIFTMLNNDFARSNFSYPIGFGGTTINGKTRYPALGVVKNPNEVMGRGRFVDADGVGVNTGQDAVQNGKRMLFSPEATTIMYHEVKKENYIRYEFDVDGETVSKDMPGKAEMKNVGKSSRMNRGSTIGSASLNNRYIDGVMSEIFAYERELNQTEKDAIYSYLALKYAVTLNRDLNDPNNNFDYFLSDGTVVWPGTSSHIHKGFHYNVAALVRDDIAAFQNYQARSTANHGILWMGLNSDNTGGDKKENLFEADRLAITWGNNGIPFDGADDLVSLRDNKDVCGTMDSRMRRVWLIDNQMGDYFDPNNHAKGRDFKPTTVTIRLGGKFFPFNGIGYQIYMLVADKSEDLFPGYYYGDRYHGDTHNWRQIVPLTYNSELHEHEVKYTLEQKYTYVTFGIKEIPGVCAECHFTGIEKTLPFTKATWGPNGSNNVNISIPGDGYNLSANVNVMFSGGAKPYNKTFPRASSLKSLNLRRRGNSTGIMTTRISLNEAAAAHFKIFEVDRSSNHFDDVEIWGDCGGEYGDILLPKLSYVNSEKNSSYRIVNVNKVKATRQASSYTNKKGQVQVDFKYPVKTIYVRHKVTGKPGPNAQKRIGIGPIDFSCPAPPPEPNEAGLSFTKKAPLKKLICEEIEYVYTIANTYCDTKYVNFEDVLPEGMMWVIDGLSLGSEAIDEKVTVINNYAGDKRLDIRNMVIPAGVELTFRATAIFKDDVEIADVNGKLFGEKARIDYDYMVEGVNTHGQLFSCDASGGTSVDRCMTKTRVYPVNNKPKILTVSSFSASDVCYTPDGEIEFTLKVNNPNPTLTDMVLDMDFTEGFTLVNNKISSPNVDLGNPVDEESEYGKTPFNGLISYEGFSLPSGESTFSFKISIPNKNALPIVCDENGNPVLNEKGETILAPLEVGFNFYSEAVGDCMEAVTANLSGYKEISGCSSDTKTHIISNKHVTLKVVK